MNIYTIEDVRLLAVIYEGNNSTANGLTDEEMKKYGGNFSYINLMETIISEKKFPGASLLEFIGAYDSAAPSPRAWDLLREFLFVTPIEEMPKHINDSGREEWKKKVAQWRLQIGK